MAGFFLKKITESWGLSVVFFVRSFVGWGCFYVRWVGGWVGGIFDADVVGKKGMFMVCMYNVGGYIGTCGVLEGF